MLGGGIRCVPFFALLLGLDDDDIDTLHEAFEISIPAFDHHRKTEGVVPDKIVDDVLRTVGVSVKEYPEIVLAMSSLENDLTMILRALRSMQTVPREQRDETRDLVLNPRAALRRMAANPQETLRKLKNWDF